MNSRSSIHQSKMLRAIRPAHTTARVTALRQAAPSMPRSLSHHEPIGYAVDGDRRPLFPELMERLDAIKRNRIGGLMLVRDWPDERAGVQLPWPAEGKGGLDYLRHRVRKVMSDAGLRPELTLTSFRHGGFTEGADADLTDRELQSIGRHKSVKALPRYAKRTMKQVSSAQQKRRQIRTDRGQISE